MLALLIKILAYIPLKIRQFLGYYLGVILSFFLKRESKIAKLQMSALLKVTPDRWMLARVFANFGQSIMESINLRPMIRQSETLIINENPELLKKLANTKHPKIVLTAHTGNWDFLAAYLIKNGIRLVTAAKKMDNKGVQVELLKVRESYGIKTVWRNDFHGTKELVKLLLDGYMVAALIDQDTRVKSKQVPFFGLPAKTPSSLIDLGLKHNAIFLLNFIFREGNNFRIYMEELDCNDTESIIRSYNNRLEELIRKYPEQWVWFHKRWRTTDQGTLSSRDYINYLKNSTWQ